VDGESQIRIPESFLRIYVEHGRIKPRLPREAIEARHELCEDLAQMLTETAQEQKWALGITDEDVLERIALGLPDCGLELEPAERDWVIARLGELLGDQRLMGR
jgi:hypothetical protein